MADQPEPTVTRRQEQSPRDARKRVQAPAVGPRPERLIREALTRLAEIYELRILPDEPVTLDGTRLTRRSLAEAAPDSQARQCLSALASEVSAAPASHLGRRRRRP
jgi:hypothetical protein